MASNLPNLELTTAEKDALKHYRAHVTRFGASPNIRQMADYCGVFPNAARHTLLNLARKGYLMKAPDTRIRLRLSAKGKKVEL